MKNCYLSFILLLLGFLPASAQFQKPDISMPSPNAASLGLYGEVPVSLYTGLPSIEIPLHTIEEGKIKVPISLSYHASGVRLNQHPGWVGLNWNLNAGGAITRTIEGTPDDYNYLPSDPNISLKGYFFNGGIFQDPDWEKRGFAENWVDVAIDTEPDEFNFNFLSYSGSFFLNENQKWVVRSNVPMTVTVDEGFLPIPESLKMSCDGEPLGFVDQWLKTFKGFTLTDAEGTSYHFGGSSDAIEYTTTFWGQMLVTNGTSENVSDTWMANTWYLTSIITAEGQVTDFIYAPFGCGTGKYLASFSPSWTATPYNFQTNVRPTIATIWGLFNFNYSCSASGFKIPDLGFYSGSLTRPVYLSRIESASQTITFSTSVSQEMKYPTRVLDKILNITSLQNVPANLFPFLNFTAPIGNGANDRLQGLLNKLIWRQLDAITIQDAQQAAVKTAMLSYQPDPAKRLTLSSVKFKDRETPSCLQNYALEYYDDTPLPPYFDLQNRTDHWGFFNDRPYNLNNLVTHVTGSIGFGPFLASKEASTDIQVLRSGSLKKITYPTGGSSTFEYEPHSVNKVKEVNKDGSFSLLASNAAIGGIRLKKTISESGDIPLEKKYVYKLSNGLSSGISSGRHEYLGQSYTVASCTDSTARFTTQVFSIQNTLPLSVNSQGSHIGYSRVTESRNDGSYTVYNYTNYESADGAHMDEAIAQNVRIPGTDGTRYEPYIDKSFERGLPLGEENYTDQGNLVRKRVVRYGKVNDTYSRGLYKRYFGPCSGNTYGLCSGFPYRIPLYKYLPTSEETHTYDQTDPALAAIDRTEYQYNTDGLPVDVKTIRSGSYTRTRTRHAGDYAITGTSPTFSDTQSALIHRMQQRGMVGRPVEQQVWNNEMPDGQERLVGGYLHTYRDYSTAAQTADGHASIQVQLTRRFVSATPPTGIALSAMTNAGGPYAFTADSRYTKTEAEFPTDATAYSWRGEPTRFRGSDGVWNTLTWGDGPETGRLKSQATGLLTTTYEYARPLVGVSKITDPTGNWKTFEYDGFNRLLRVRDRQNRLLKSYRYFLTNSSGCL